MALPRGACRIPFRRSRTLPSMEGGRPRGSGAGSREPPSVEGRVEQHGHEDRKERKKDTRPPAHALPFPVPSSISLALTTIGLNGSFSMKIVNCSLASPLRPSRSSATARLNRACE